MGASGSSSKRKSSKRKRDKRKKSRRKESKRRRRDHDSASSYSDDGSFNSEDSSKSDRGRRKSKTKKLRRDSSLSSSSSDDLSVSSDSDSLSAYKQRRKHSKTRRSRVSVRSKKKRDQKRFTSSDSDAGNARKRKRVDRDVKPRKKSSKKRPRKYLNSESESSPTRRSGSSLDGKHRRSTKVIVDEEKARARGRESNKARDKHRVRSPSYSPYGQESDHSIDVNDVDGAITRVDNPRRLKSVIAVVEQSHDGGEDRWEKDPHKEEIVYDREDYPSPKSLDSYEGGAKVESDNSSHGAYSERVSVGNLSGLEATQSRKPGIYESGQKTGGETQSEGAHKDNIDKKEMDMSGPAAAAAALGGEDLESILRQKALENLRKFRGKQPVGPKCTNLKASDPSAGRVDSVQYESIKQDSSKAREMESRSDPSSRNNVKEFPDDEPIETEYGTSEQTAEAVLLACSKEDKHELTSSASPGAGAANACNSSMTPTNTLAGTVEGENSVEEHNEDKDGSQFEQRTMSVMRGGEMVQVSYKVYIPKKAPALARRQLRR